MTHCISACWLAAVAFSTLHAVPLRVLAIGDSMTEEYAFELPFSAPDSNPANPNTDNWPAILTTHRATWLTLGSYRSAVLSWLDLRDGGYEYNYGVPGFTTTDWVGVCQSTAFDLLSSDPIIVLRYPTLVSLINNLTKVDAVIIFLGGNDLKSNYTGIYSAPQPPALLAQAVANLASIHDFVWNRTSLPIIIATVPDIGATLDWAAGAGDFLANPDGDGLPNLTEYVLGTSPTHANSPFVFAAGGLMRFTPSLTAQNYAAMVVEDSFDLGTWLPVPTARITVAADGAWEIAPSGGSRGFYRLAVTPRP